MKLALFDFDGTVTREDTFTAFVKFATPPLRLKVGYIALIPKILGYKLGFVKGTNIRQSIVYLAFKGLRKDYLEDKAKSFFESYMNTVLRPNAIEKLKWHKENGDRIVLVSASLDIYLKHWCRDNEIELICSEVDFDGEFCTGKYKSSDCSGLYKAEKVKDILDLKEFDEIYAYGDTSEDKELLDLADHKYLCWEKI